MATIGTFTKTEKDFTGSVKTLTLNVKARFVVNDGATEKAPDYRIFTGPIEFGVGWNRTAESGRDYISVKLDDPSFPGPIYASLIETDEAGVWNLIWSRPNPNA